MLPRYTCTYTCTYTCIHSSTRVRVRVLQKKKKKKKIPAACSSRCYQGGQAQARCSLPRSAEMARGSCCRAATRPCSSAVCSAASTWQQEAGPRARGRRCARRATRRCRRTPRRRCSAKTTPCRRRTPCSPQAAKSTHLLPRKEAAGCGSRSRPTQIVK